jgi:L-aminopeptidase/D-esterase-like protein
VIAGVRSGHATDLAGATGCTVLLPPPGAVCAAEVRGQAPGTREVALLGPAGVVEHADAILLTGGSAFGLAAADGVVEGLAAAGVGYATPAGPVPIVSAAVIFDLPLVAPTRPGRAEGAAALAAAVAAVPGSLPERGSVGAGTGATVGAVLGHAHATKGGLGVARVAVGEATVAALVVANALGDVIGEDGRVLAGLRDPGGHASTAAAILALAAVPAPGPATTLAVVATDAALDKRDAWRLARSAHGGIARVVVPTATTFDGDVAFAVATGERVAPPLVALETAAAQAVADAIRDAVRSATGLGGVPGLGDP